MVVDCYGINIIHTLLLDKRCSARGRRGRARLRGHGVDDDGGYAIETSGRRTLFGFLVPPGGVGARSGHHHSKAFTGSYGAGVNYDVDKDVETAHRVFMWLRAQEIFDVIHFADSKGLGFFRVW